MDVAPKDLPERLFQTKDGEPEGPDEKRLGPCRLGFFYASPRCPKRKNAVSADDRPALAANSSFFRTQPDFFFGLRGRRRSRARELAGATRSVGRFSRKKRFLHVT